MAKLFVKVCCEYDISGKFGGNNNEDVFHVYSDDSAEDIEAKVLDHLTAQTGLTEDDLEDLYSWECIEISEL